MGDLPESSFVKTLAPELESHPVTETEPHSSHRGSLPKDSTEEPPQGLDPAPEPVTETEGEATPEQLSHADDLQPKIDDS